MLPNENTDAQNLVYGTVVLTGGSSEALSQRTGSVASQWIPECYIQFHAKHQAVL